MKSFIKHSLILLLTMTLFSVSCKKEDAADPENAYKGEWLGTFDGGDSGSWEMTVDKNVDFSGTMTSDGTGSSYDITGFIDQSGVLEAIIVVQGDTIDFIGTGSNGNHVEGTWSNPGNGLSGTWEGDKQ